MKQLGRSVGRAGDYNHLFSLAPSVPSPPRVHTAALRYSKATATVVALPLTSDPLCLTALARVKLCALVYLDVPLAPQLQLPANPHCARETILLLYHEE